MRVTIVRIGVALGCDGGALEKMLPAFRLGGGGVVGNGRQWLSWVHVDDVVGIFLKALDGATGVLNATAPNPVTNAQFTHALGSAIGRPTPLTIPPFALRLMLGEGAAVVLTGQRVLPERTTAQGYTFAYSEINAALRSLT